MKWILWTMVALVAAVGVIAVVGWLLPIGHVASRSSLVSRAPEQVYSVIADVASYASWLDGTSRVELLDASKGNIRFRQHSSSGPIVMEVEEATPPSRFVTRIADPDQPFGGTWTFELTPQPGGTRVQITENGEVYNPIFRFMARFVFGHAATMDGYLASLTKKLNGS